jgi:hypothetical protein
MVKRPSVSASAAKAPIDGDGKAIANKILLSLPRKERDQVLSKLELVRLKLQQVIHEAGETIKSGYFVNAGVISVLAVQPDGKSVEVGLIGNEGFVGLPLLVGYRSSPTRLITPGRRHSLQVRCGCAQATCPTMSGIAKAVASFCSTASDADHPNRGVQSIARCSRTFGQVDHDDP